MMEDTIKHIGSKFGGYRYISTQRIWRKADGIHGTLMPARQSKIRNASPSLIPSPRFELFPDIGNVARR